MSRNAVIGLAEMHEMMAQGCLTDDARVFHQLTADLLRALVDQRDYPRE
jgi:hypothetical protein